MESTSKDYKITARIVAILTEECYTTSQAVKILSDVNRVMHANQWLYEQCLTARRGATEKQMTELTQAMVDFSKRVLQGKDCTLQETATLPSVLSLLLCGEKLDK